MTNFKARFKQPIKEPPFDIRPLIVEELNSITSESGRFYEVGGEKYPSVTTVLSIIPKPGLQEWKDRVGADAAAQIMKQAADRGTKAHKMWEEYLRNNTDYAAGMMPSTIQLFKQLKEWLDTNVEYILGNEIPLYSKSLRMAGRCDAVASINGKPAIVDFKTSTKEKKLDYIENYLLQVTAYAQMVKEMYGIHITDAYILIAVEEGSPQHFHVNTSNYLDKLYQVSLQYHSNR